MTRYVRVPVEDVARLAIFLDQIAAQSTHIASNALRNAEALREACSLVDDGETDENRVPDSPPDGRTPIGPTSAMEENNGS